MIEMKTWSSALTTCRRPTVDLPLLDMEKEARLMLDANLEELGIHTLPVMLYMRYPHNPILINAK